LFVVRCSLFVVRRSSFVVCRLFAGCVVLLLLYCWNEVVVLYGVCCTYFVGAFVVVLEESLLTCFSEWLVVLC